MPKGQGRMARNRVTIQQTQRMALTTGLLTSISILRADAASLTKQLDELAAENSQLVLTRPPVQDWLPRWKAAFASVGDQPELAAAAQSLIAHVLDMVAAMDLDPQEAQIAEALVAALEPTGWLGRPLAAIASEAGASLAATEAILQRLQERAEPSGLFARNLAECLRLQAHDADELCWVMHGVLGRLELLAKGDIDRLARDMGATTTQIRDAVGRLRAYDPKPGARFEVLAAPVREPDLIAEKGSSGWTIALNRSALPAVSVAAGRGKGHAEAKAMVKMIEGRNTTLLAVAQEVLTRQSATLDQGAAALQPMTMADVAEALGLHESTVSRVIAGASVDTPRGTWWLRALFTQAPREGGLSAAALRDRLSRLIAAEDGNAPLSDEALAAHLADGGTPIARRTVAKYREMLKLPPAHRRRRRE